MQSIREAHARIRDKIHRTPVMTSEVLDGLAGNRLYFKCENLQKVGAFKARGATNAVFLLTDAEAAKGVVTHSSGVYPVISNTAGLANWIGLLVVVQNVFTSLFNSHIFDFHEGWMYVLGVGVAGGMVLKARAAEADAAAENP